MNFSVLSSFSWLAALLPVLACLYLLRRPLGWLARLFVRTLSALAALLLLSPASKLLGVTLGINWLNALVLGLLGTPGFGLLLMLQWLLQSP